MRRPNPRRAAIALSMAVLALAVAPLDGSAREREYFHPELIVESTWLEENAGHPALRIVDFGRESSDYDDGHIPGAVFVDAEWISAEIDGVPDMLARVEKVVAVLAQAGVGDATTVVIYDDGSGLWASRLFWSLEFLGHRDARVLNGGWSRWIDEGRETSAELPVVVPGELTPAVDLSVLATREWILDNLSRGDLIVLDVRSPEEYTGEDAQAARGGHIPGAIAVDWNLALSDGDVRTFLSVGELRGLYQSAGVTPGLEIVTYCQGGVRAAHTYLVLRLLGYPRVRVYDGSWVEWGNDSGAPVVTGASPE